MFFTSSGREQIEAQARQVVPLRARAFYMFFFDIEGISCRVSKFVLMSSRNKQSFQLMMLHFPRNLACEEFAHEFIRSGNFETVDSSPTELVASKTEEASWKRFP